MKWIKTFETVSSQKNLEQLEISILKFMADRTFNNHIRIRSDGVKFFNGISGVMFKDLDLDLYDEKTQKFIKETNIFVIPKIEIISNIKGNVTKGRYTKDEIYLKYDKDFIEKIDSKLNDESFEYDSSDLYFNLWYEFSSTLLHELQHAYHDWESKGGYTNNKKWSKYKNEKDNLTMSINKGEYNDEVNYMKSLELYKKYQNLKHEIDARFTQAIQKTRFWSSSYENNDYSKPAIQNKRNFNDVLKDFKTEFEGWLNLSPKMQKILTKKLAIFWNSDYKKIK